MYGHSSSSYIHVLFKNHFGAIYGGLFGRFFNAIEFPPSSQKEKKESNTSEEKEAKLWAKPTVASAADAKKQ